MLENQPTMRRISNIHFVGIGGVGMCGIAEVLANLGYAVSGSDVKPSANTKRMQQIGIEVFFNHAPENVKHADVLVVSSAVTADNVELKYAKKHRIPIVPRAEMLAELMRFRKGIAVAGTHGKTTTTSLVASVLAEGGLDPTFVIGGQLNSHGVNAKLGKSEYLVAEADESDASFLYLQPMIAIVTNVDAEHLSTYQGEFSNLKQTFIEFLHHLPFYGLAVLCIDDIVLQTMLEDISRPIITYGLNENADVRAKNVRYMANTSIFEVELKELETTFKVELNMPGEHNVQNALAAIAVGIELGVDIKSIRNALLEFAGIERRFQIHGTINIAGKNVLLVDDYGHHPSEVKMTIEAARNAWQDKRLLVLFQPHRYSRTQDLFEDFAQVLSTPDVLLLLEVYPAGEKQIVGADGRALAAAIRARGKVNPVFIAEVADIKESLGNLVANDDVLLTMGAGDIGAVASELYSAYKLGADDA